MKALLACLLLSLPLLSACDGENDQVYAESKKCAEEIARGGDCSRQQGENGDGRQGERPRGAGPEPSPPQTEPARSSPIEESRVYLDATESMQGFASTENNNNFTRLIESLSYALPGCRLYKYGMRKGGGADAGSFASEIRFSQDLRKPAFYDLDYNEDDALINHLAQEDRPVLSVLVTDGVYSARQSELQSGVLKAIEGWMKRGRFFGILIFTGRFEGRLYSENRRLWIDGVSVDDRPFYAFVFSPDEKGFRDLKEKLSADFGGMQALAFPSQAIICQLNPQTKAGLIFRDAWPNTPYYLQMYDASVFEDKDVAELFYEFRCLPAVNYPVSEFGLEVTPDYYAWRQDSFEREERRRPQFEHKYPAEESAGEAVPSPSPSSPPAGATAPASPPATPARLPRLKLTFQRDTASSYSFYHLNFTLSSKGLQPGIRARSTEDDSEPRDADKTYRLYEFISALTAVHLQDAEAIKLPPPVFVTLTNK